MADAALTTALNTDSRYSGAVPGGGLGPLLDLLNERDPVGGFVFHDVPIADVLEAAGQARMKALTDAERGRLSVLRDEGLVRLSKPQIRAEFLDVFGITEDQLAAGVPESRTRPRFCEAFGFERVTKQDLFRVLRDVPTSALAVYWAGVASKISAAELLHEQHLQGLNEESYQNPGVVDNG
ncbi:hypothetical protein LCGC14_1795890 [marine sediment metagenome]|uniref:Uncharacterized protein n=1 Tax=marine sediment metagenome TaxID=412755 RepID=A0A0F9J5Z2_9ZZZZ